MEPIILDNEEFVKKWKNAHILACPLLRGIREEGTQYWLSPVGKSVCGQCPCWTCHNHEKSFNLITHLIVPREPMPQLIKEQVEEWLEKWDERDCGVRIFYRDVKKWYHNRYGNEDK